MIIRSLFLAAAIPWMALPAELPGPVLPAGVGVNIHFTRGHERDLDMIAEAGFRFIRMDFGWAATERKKGEYEWSEYEELTSNLEKRGIRPYYILDYSNPLYEETVTGKNPITGAEHRDTASPQHPQSVAAFARWAAAAAGHFHGRHVVWEIWNEPNISFWKPKPDAGQYTALALATCKAIREADAGATIVAPATSTFPWGFLDNFLKSGVLEYLDGVSVHPYRSKERPPETATADYLRLRGLIERYAPDEARKKIAIISGEWGYSSHTRGVSPETQAAFIARQQLSNLLDGVPISIWYDWENDGEDPDENEQNFGTVTHDLKPKPAYVAIQTLTRELSGYRIDHRHNTTNEKDFVLVLTNAKRQTRLAVWTVGEPHDVTLELMPTAATAILSVASDGGKRKLQVERNRLTVGLTAAPGYLSLDQAKLR